MAAAGEHLLLYDGVCGLCNRVNRFVLRHDRRRQFDFASLQSDTARVVLSRFGQRAEALETFYIVAGYRSASPTLVSRSRAALFLMRTLGWPWRAMTVAGIVPAAILDRAYDIVARHRYRVFGRYDTCPIPDPEHRARFIELNRGG